MRERVHLDTQSKLKQEAKTAAALIERSPGKAKSNKTSETDKRKAARTN